MKLSNFIPGVAQMKTIAAAAVGLAVLTVCTVLIVTSHKLREIRAWQDSVIAVTSTAAHATDKNGRPALLKAEDVPSQIKELGQAVDAIDVATDTAKRINTDNNTRIAAAQDAVTKEKADDIDKKLAAARAAGAADYARRVRDTQGAGATDRGASGKAGTGTAPNAAGDPVGAGGMSVMDEDNVRICSDNTVKALGWRETFAAFAAIPQ